MAITILFMTNVKKMLGIPSSITRYDDAITETLGVTQQILLDELNLTNFISTSYSESYDIDVFGTNEVALDHRPIVSVAAMTIGGKTSTENTDYILNKPLGIVKLDHLAESFPVGRSQVQVTYTAGYGSTIDDIPKDIQYAGHLICCSLFNQQSHLGFVSERAGSYSYSLGKGTGSTIPAMAERILNKYRRLFARGMNIQ
jgi:hypothetical protein